MAVNAADGRAGFVARAEKKKKAPGFPEALFVQPKR
jgi:hypothetical protein